MLQIRFTLFTATLYCSYAFGQKMTDTTGSISGRVYNEKKEPLIGGIVEVYSTAAKAGGAVTDTNGMFKIVNLTPGKDFDVIATYPSYKAHIIKGVSVVVGKNSFVTLNFSADVITCPVTRYQPPLMNERGSMKIVFSGDDVKNIPAR